MKTLRNKYKEQEASVEEREGGKKELINETMFAIPEDGCGRQNDSMAFSVEQPNRTERKKEKQTRKLVLITRLSRAVRLRQMRIN